MTTNTKQSKRTPYEALGNELRLGIVMCLAKSERNVVALAKELGAGQALVSSHLKKLVDAGFAVSRTEGKYRYYALNEEFAAPFLAALDAGWSPKAPSGILRGVVGQLPVSILVTDKRGSVLLAAGQPLQGLGAVPSDLPGASVFDMFDDRKAAIVSLSAAFRGEAVHWSGAIRGVKFQLHSIPYKDPRGNDAGAITIGLESSPSHDAQRHVAEVGEWKMLAQTMDGAVMQLAADGKIQAHTRSLMEPGRDFTGTNFWDNIKMLGDESREAASKAVATAMRTGQMTDYVVSIEVPGKADRRFECRVVPHWNEGAVDGVTIVSRELHGPEVSPTFFVR